LIKAGLLRCARNDGTTGRLRRESSVCYTAG
jgi:hypothetical protein